MGSTSRKSNQRFCAFCRSEIKVFPRKTLGIVNIGISAICSLFLVFISKNWVDPRFLLAWVGFVVVGEIFIQIRWRLSIMCQSCGFDPILYIKNRPQAASNVKAHLLQRTENRKTKFVRHLKIPSLTLERAKELGFWKPAIPAVTSPSLETSPLGSLAKNDALDQV